MLACFQKALACAAGLDNFGKQCWLLLRSKGLLRSLYKRASLVFVGGLLAGFWCVAESACARGYCFTQYSYLIAHFYLVLSFAATIKLTCKFGSLQGAHRTLRKSLELFLGKVRLTEEAQPLLVRTPKACGKA